MTFRTLITSMTQAACAGDANAIVACFTPDGVYHDVFYGAFQGAEIGRMITDFFHRDACNFRWDVKEALADDDTGMARYVFSYESKLPGVEGTRSMFEGVAICTLRGGLIHRYSEVADVTPGLVRLGFSDARLAKFANRSAKTLAERTESAGHL